MNQIGDLLNYFKFAEDLYPNGIPVSLFRQSPATKNVNKPGVEQNAEESGVSDLISEFRVWGTPESRLLLITEVDDVNVPYSGKRGEFLKTVINKGLELDESKVLVLAVAETVTAAEPELQKLIDSLIKESGVVATLMLGSMLPQKVSKTSMGKFDESSFGYSHSLNSVMSSIPCKKEFWEHLKLVKSLINQS